MNVVSFFHRLFILILCFDHDYQQKKKKKDFGLDGWCVDETPDCVENQAFS